MMRIAVALAVASFSILGLAAASESGAAAKRYDLNIPRQTLDTALKDFAAQTGLQIARFSDTIDGSALVGPLIGQHSAATALESLLAPHGLSYKIVNERTIAVVNPKDPQPLPAPRPSPPRSTTGAEAGEERRTRSAMRLAQAEQTASPAKEEEEKGKLEEHRVVLPEILVVGSKSLNTDIVRTPDDIQPYVVFNREQIEHSGANNLEVFLKQRLTANATVTSNQQGSGFNSGNVSSINLRGLGSSQTLVLIDGHRAAAQPIGQSGSFTQPDLNGIPLAAIERIEVLPTTASGIYGGGATGGVVNIILRRDYEGAVVRLTYDNTFDTGNAIRRVDFSAGFVLEEGNTSILLAGSYSDANELRTQDRNFVTRARETIVRNLGGPANLEGPIDPPLGATVNVRSVNGSPLFGPGTSNITFLPPGYTGAAGLGLLQANAGQYNLDLADSGAPGLPNGGGAGGLFSLGSVPTVESVGLTIRRQFSPKVKAFIDAGASNNTSVGWNAYFGTRFTIPANAPTNPFGQAVRVNVPTSATDSPNIVALYSRRMVGGLLFGLPREWESGLDYSWGRTRYYNIWNRSLAPSAATAVASGTLDVLRDPSTIDFSSYLQPESYLEPYHLTMQSGAWRVSGPLWELPAGALRLTGMIEHRRDETEESFSHSPAGSSSAYAATRSQDTSGAYLEALVPLVSARNALSGVKELEVQLAGRYDDYTLHGANLVVYPLGTPLPTASIVRVTNRFDTVNPTIGLKYVPTNDLALRASYGTGFVPPNLFQLTPNSPQIVPAATQSDPSRGGTPIPAGWTSTSGGNPDLTPEESESWSVGGIFTPSFVPGVRLSVDYTEIRKRGNIANLSTQAVLDNEAILPDRVTRGPNLPGDQPGWEGPVIAVNSTAVNISRTLVTAYDVALDYRRRAGAWGAFDFHAAATRHIHFRTQVAPTSAVLEQAGSFGTTGATNAIPTKLKANAGVTWKYGQWTAGWNARYFDKYLVVHPSVSTSATTYLRQGSTHVPSQAYHDLFAVCRFGKHGWLENTDLQMGIRNVFDKEPPFDVNAVGSNFYSNLGDARLRTYYLTLEMSL